MKGVKVGTEVSSTTPVTRSIGSSRMGRLDGTDCKVLRDLVGVQEFQENL